MTTTKSPALRVFKKTPEADLKLHIFAPDGQADCCIVFFTCGGWNGFHPPKFFPQSSYLVTRGACCMVAEVRTIAEHGTSPRECVADAKSALRAARDMSTEFGFPADKLVAAGGSAAGHVVLSCAMIKDFDDEADNTTSCIPNLVIAYNPLVVAEMEESSSSAEQLQARIEKAGGVEQLMALSPMRAIRPGLSPILILTGEDDPVTTLHDAQLFQERMLSAGNDCRLVAYPKAAHGFFNYNGGGNPFFRQTTEEIDRYLCTFGFLKNEGTMDGFVYEGEH